MKSLGDIPEACFVYMKAFPNNDLIEKFTEYFISVDKEYKNRLDKRKAKDKERYEKKSKKSS